MKKNIKLFTKIFIFTVIFYVVLCVGMAAIGELFNMSEKSYDMMLNIGIAVSLVFIIAVSIYFVSSSQKVEVKHEKMKAYKDYVIMDVLSMDNNIFGVYLYKYKNDEYHDKFFLSLYNGYKIDNADLILNKISLFLGKNVLIFDTVANIENFNKLFVVNAKEVLSNEKVAINQYVKINNIRKDFAKSSYEFTPIEDVFVECSKTLNADSTKQLFEGKLLYILSYYNNLKEVSQ